ARVDLPDADVRVPEPDVDLPDVDAKLPEAEVELPDAEVELPDADAKLPEADVDLPDAEAELPGIDVSAPEAEVDVPDADVELSDVEAELPDAAADLPDAAVDLTDSSVDADAEVAEPVVATPESSREKVAAEIAVRTAGEGPNPEDDLREVHGIGEVISKMLYSMNITSFRQIARFTPADISVVSHALEVFPDRVTRDDWMSSARQLHIAKYGDDPVQE
ncbi:MAG: hypothetical protein FWF28_08320, partial [Micrococcales bacterium]|nr:hypothetical protein [Micrococcales bacterium]